MPPAGRHARGPLVLPRDGGAAAVRSLCFSRWGRTQPAVLGSNPFLRRGDEEHCGRIDIDPTRTPASGLVPLAAVMAASALLREFDGALRSQQPLHALRHGGGTYGRVLHRRRSRSRWFGHQGPGFRARSAAFFAFNLSRPLLDAADAKSDGAAYAAAAINILDGPTVNHHRLREHAGVFTDYVTLIIYEGTPFIELILQRSCTYSGLTSNGIGPLVQRRVIRRLY